MPELTIPTQTNRMDRTERDLVEVAVTVMDARQEQTAQALLPRGTFERTHQTPDALLRELVDLLQRRALADRA